MIKQLLRIGLGMAAATLLASPGAMAQDSAKNDSKETTQITSQPETDSKNPRKKISLTDVTKVSTEDAARSAAHEAATPKSKKQETGKDSDAVVDSITEFSPAPHDADSASKTNPKVSKRSSKAKIHGEAYGGLGSTNSGNRQTGGAVGTTSKSGKTSVYVQGEQTRSTTSTPH
jgi:hypothetical protein